MIIGHFGSIIDRHDHMIYCYRYDIRVIRVKDKCFDAYLFGWPLTLIGTQSCSSLNGANDYLASATIVQDYLLRILLKSAYVDYDRIILQTAAYFSINQTPYIMLYYSVDTIQTVI